MTKNFSSSSVVHLAAARVAVEQMEQITSQKGAQGAFPNTNSLIIK